MYVGDRIKKLRNALGMSQSKLASLVGITQPTLSHLEKTEDASTKYIDEFASALNTTSDYLLYGNGSHQVVDANYQPPQGMISVPYFKEVVLSAGNGGCVIEEKNQDDSILFPVSFFSRHSANPENVICLKISGDSMEPKFEDGGIVTIDRGYQKIIDGTIYAINHQDHLYFKRIHNIAPGKLMLSSENPIYRPLEADCNDVIIIGKVINYSKDL